MLCASGQTNLTDITLINLGVPPFGNAGPGGIPPKSDVAPLAFAKANTNFLILSNAMGNYTFTGPVSSNSFSTFNLVVSNSLILTKSWFVLNYIDWTNNLAWPTNLPATTCTNTQGPFYQAYVTNSSIAYTNQCGFTMLFNTSTNFHLPGWNVPTNQIFASAARDAGTEIVNGIYYLWSTNLTVGGHFFDFAFTNINQASTIGVSTSMCIGVHWPINTTAYYDCYGGAYPPIEDTDYYLFGIYSTNPAPILRFYYGTSNSIYSNLIIPSLPFAFIPPSPTNAPSTNPPPQFSIISGCGEYLTFRKGTTNLYLMGAQNIMASASYVRVRLGLTNSSAQIGLYGPDRDGTVIVTRYGVANQTIAWGDTNYWRPYPPSPPCGTP